MTVKDIADLLASREPDRPGVTLFEDREVGHRDAHFLNRFLTALAFSGGDQIATRAGCLVDRAVRLGLISF